MTAEKVSFGNRRLRAYLVDDELLAIRRLKRLLEEAGRVDIAGSTCDPRTAIEFLRSHPVDVLFLDIEMPEMNGFELVARLEDQPLIIFTTAFDRYALKAFEVNSIDYLLKPVDTQQLGRALGKLERIGSGGRQDWAQRPDIQSVLEEISRSLRPAEERYVSRIASRVGERVQFIDVSQITHFFAQDKLTYAVARGRAHPVNYSIADLERKLNPRQFLRIHRAAMVNLGWVHEVDSATSGGVLVRLSDETRTELDVARDRVRTLKNQLGCY